MDFKVSVRSLVEFVYRSGDYDRTRGTSEDAMAQGTRIHRLIQSRQGMDYKPEVPLSLICRGDNYDIYIDGRADGIITGENGFTIDEIKGTYKDVNRMEEPFSVHLAQAKCYAYIYGITEYPEAFAESAGNSDKSDNNLNPVRMAVRLTYCNMDTEDIRYFNISCDVAELKEWFDNTVNYYRRFMDISYNSYKRAAVSIKELPFPFEYRPGQRDLMAQVYSTIRHEKKLFLQAPTGTGKTLAAVYPSVKALGLGHARRIFYLTARNTAANMPSDSLSLLRDKGLFLVSLELSSRDRICFLEKAQCDPFICPYAKGHFDRVNEVLYKLLTGSEKHSAADISAAAREGEVCPFELGLDAASFSQMIICDYNYAFDPEAKLQRFFGEGCAKDNIFLIDEAHNLLERGRDMYSACLNTAQINDLRSIFIHRDKRISAGTGRVKKEFKLIEPDGDYSIVEVSNSLIHELTLLFDRLGTFFEKVSREKRMGHSAPGGGITETQMESALEFYFNLSHFLDMYDNMDGDYSIYTRVGRAEGTVLQLYCTDPSKSLKRCMEKAISSILFSATLLPIQYYKSLLGGTSDDYEVYARSSFDPARLGIFIGKDVTSRYERRGEALYRKIASYIHEACSQKTGNYMVFFPSYRFMGDVFDIYKKEYDDPLTRCIVQHPDMGDAQRREFLDAFMDSGREGDIPEIPGMDVEIEDTSLIGFCIMGSIFSEGIDLTGDSLIGILIAGTGTPMVCTEREVLKSHFDRGSRRGFDYAYKYPGMNKVLQSAGRLIRTVSDAGFVILMDDRFLNSSYNSLFPREWRGFSGVSSDSVGKAVKEFWDSVMS